MSIYIYPCLVSLRAFWILLEEDEDVILSYLPDGHNKQVTYVWYCDSYLV
jgi:hypothetical protein